jgi:hypothetical protein
MHLENFENDIFYQNFNTNLNKIVQRFFLTFKKIFLKPFLRIIQEYSLKSSHFRVH